MITRSLLADIFVAFVRCIRPLLGPEVMCIFRDKTCTAYAGEQLRTQPLHRAIIAITWRLLRCNPITALWHYNCGLRLGGRNDDS